MKHKKTILVGVSILIIIFLGIIAFYFFNNKSDTGMQSADNTKVGFELDTIFLKVSVETNGTAISHIKIKNLEDYIDLCEISVSGLEGLVKLSNDTLNLDIHGQEDLELVFNTDREPGIYTGELIFSSSCKTQTVPIVLELQSSVVVFDANVNLYPAGRDLVKGDILNANIRIYDLASIGKHEIKVTYFIKGFDGVTSVSEIENLIIDERLDYTKSLDISKNLEVGKYVFAVIIEYTDFAGVQSIGTSSVLFDVVKKSPIPTASNSFTYSNNLVFLVIIIFGFFFLLFLGLFIYFLFFRDKMLREITRQYEGELRRQRNMIEDQRKQDYARLKSPEERREYKKEVEIVKKLRLAALKKVKDRKIQDFHKIKKKFKGNKLEKQLSRWKKQGYDTKVLEKKYRLPNVNDIKSKINKWKKQGYDTRVLEKK